MANPSKSQWCHDSIKVVMGQLECELLPSIEPILTKLDQRLSRFGVFAGFVREILEERVGTSWLCLSRDADREKFSPELTTNNLWQNRCFLAAYVAAGYGTDAGEEAMKVIDENVKGPTAKLHLNRGPSSVEEARRACRARGSFTERLATLSGRIAAAARWKDMLGVAVPEKPWLSGLARSILVSDIRNEYATPEVFDWLGRSMMPPIRSELGRRHLWLMLTKRPSIMAAFAHRIGGFTENVCAMTSVTGPDSLVRVGHLQQVSAPVKGLSVEPVLQPFDPEGLDLNGIDWVILGGESGKFDLVSPFDLGWLRQMIASCRRRGVAVFVKQLGRKPVLNGEVLRLRDAHGGDWDEWPEDLRVREFPRYLHDYRRHN